MVGCSLGAQCSPGVCASVSTRLAHPERQRRAPERSSGRTTRSALPSTSEQQPAHPVAPPHERQGNTHHLDRPTGREEATATARPNQSPRCARRVGAVRCAGRLAARCLFVLLCVVGFCVWLLAFGLNVSIHLLLPRSGLYHSLPGRGPERSEGLRAPFRGSGWGIFGAPYVRARGSCHEKPPTVRGLCAHGVRERAGLCSGWVFWASGGPLVGVAGLCWRWIWGPAHAPRARVRGAGVLDLPHVVGAWVSG